MFSSSWSPLGSYDINLYCVCSFTYCHPVRYFSLFRFSLYRSKPQNWKSQYPPYFSLTFVHDGTTWSLGAKKLQMGLRSIMSRRIYTGLLRDICNFHWKYFNFFTPPFFLNSLLFCKRFDCLFFKTLCFLRSVIRSVIGPWSDPWSKPVQILPTPLRFRTPDISMVTLPSLQTVPRWGPHCHLAPVVLK